MEYDEYLRSPEWREKADAVMERERSLCQRCGDPAREVHHKTYERIFCEPLTDLEALCVRCHELAHGLLPPDQARRQERRQTEHCDRAVRDLYAPKRRWKS
jgi:5-methylcytosine-specific restriction endonuclease McrA